LHHITKVSAVLDAMGVSFMQYNVGFFDHETCRLENIEKPSSLNLILYFN